MNSKLRAFCVLLFSAWQCVALDHALTPRVVKTQFPTDDVVIATAVVTEDPFLAIADGKTDCTAPMQMAIDAVHKLGGGVVYLPGGRYFFKGNLLLKEGVTLRGDWKRPEKDLSVQGTILMPTAGRGKPDGQPFITTEYGTGVRNLSIWYPEQDMNQIAPYPWTLRPPQDKFGDNTTVYHVTLVNSYQAMCYGPMGNELHTVRDVYGTPLKCGIWMHMCTDIGRLSCIDFSPKYWLESGLVEHADADALKKFLREQGTGVEILRSDWEYMFDCKLEGYARGIHIHADTNAALYQVVATGGAVGLQIDSLIPAGLAVTNSRFDGTDAGIVGNGGTVAQFNNCSIGGQAKCGVRIEGRMKLSFQNCTFAGWADYAVLARQGTVNLFGCDFKYKGPHVRLERGVERAHLLGNSCEGEWILQNESSGDVQVTAHDFHFSRPHSENVVLPPDPRPATDKFFNVADYGAKTEEKFDNAGAFTSAFTAAEKAGGGTVYVPAGNYWFSNPITVPSGVELRGCFDVPHHTWSGGSVLMNLGGRGEENGTPFISLSAKSGIRGITIWYPEQDIRNVVAYPWAIQSKGDSCWVVDVSTSNAYQSADFGTYSSENHLVRYLGGAPLRRGLWVSKGSGVVDSCHFNPHFWSRHPAGIAEPKGQPQGEQPVWEYQQQHLEAFVIGHCAKELQVHNFVFAAAHGIKLVDDHGALGGTLINPGADACGFALTIDAAENAELINTELTVFGNWAHATCKVTENFVGKISLFNSLSWGSPAPTCIFAGKGDILLQQWNSVQGPMQAIAGRIRLENLHFQNAMVEAVQTSSTVERLEMIGSTSEGIFVFKPGPNILARISNLPLGNLTGGSFRADFEKAQPDYTDHAETVTNVEGRYCRVEKDAGRENSAGLVISGENKGSKPSHVYYHVFNVNVPVTNRSFMSYWMKPFNEMSRHSGVDLYFTDGSNLRDSAARDIAGNPLHPAFAKGTAGQWAKVDCPIGQWLAGKVIRTIVVAYDDSESTGNFKTAFDDIEIGLPVTEKPIKLQATAEGSALKAPVSVQLTSDGKCAIHYTLDGTVPSGSSSFYANAIVLDKPDLYEIRCVGIDENKHLVAPVKSFLFDVR